jgi:hypothetical protein
MRRNTRHRSRDAGPRKLRIPLGCDHFSTRSGPFSFIALESRARSSHGIDQRVSLTGCASYFYFYLTLSPHNDLLIELIAVSISAAHSTLFQHRRRSFMRIPSRRPIAVFEFIHVFISKARRAEMRRGITRALRLLLIDGAAMTAAHDIKDNPISGAFYP